jgi:hypothetical protein
MLLALVVIWSDPERVRGLVAPMIGLADRPLALTRNALIGGFLAGLTQVTFYAYALWLVARLFRSFASGVVFVQGNADTLRAIGWTLILAALLAPVTRALQSAALTLDNPAGQRVVAVQLDFGTFAALLGGGAVLGFAAVMREAVRLADENRQFV